MRRDRTLEYGIAKAVANDASKARFGVPLDSPALSEGQRQAVMDGLPATVRGMIGELDRDAADTVRLAKVTARLNTWTIAEIVEAAVRAGVRQAVGGEEGERRLQSTIAKVRANLTDDDRSEPREVVMAKIAAFTGKRLAK